MGLENQLKSRVVKQENVEEVEADEQTNTLDTLTYIDPPTFAISKATYL